MIQIKCRDSFRTTEIITGSVCIDTQGEELVVNGLLIAFSGFEQVFASNVFGKKLPLKKSTIINKFNSLLGSKAPSNPDGTPCLDYKGYQEPIHIKGESTYNFTFEIPRDAPSSVTFSNASIEYQLKAILVPVFGANVEKVHPIIVGNSIRDKEHATLETRYQSNGPYYVTHQMEFIQPTSSDIQIVATLDKPVVFIGEDLKLTLDLNLNLKGNKNLKIIKAKLKQSTSINVVGYSSSEIQTVTKVQERDYERQLIRGKHRVVITIPITNPCIQPDVSHSKNIRCHHYVLVVIPTQWNDQLSIKVPIVIEQPPQEENTKLNIVPNIPKSRRSTISIELPPKIMPIK